MLIGKNKPLNGLMQQGTDKMEQVSSVQVFEKEKIDLGSRQLESEMFNIKTLWPLDISSLKEETVSIDFSNSIMKPANQKKKSWFLELQTGAYIVNRSLTSSSTDYQPILESRLSGESPLEAIQGTIFAGHYFSKNFGLKTGLSYKQISELFEYNNSYTIEEMREVVDTILIYGPSPEDFYEIRNQEIAIQTVEREIQGYTRYKMLDIPLIMFYELKFNRFSFGLETGPFFNLSFDKSGWQFDDLLIPGKLNPDLYKHSLSVNWHTGIHISYELHHALSLNLNPSIRMIPNIARKESAFSQPYRLYGLNLGVRWKL